MNPFIQQLVDDLKDFSAELLAPGLGGTQQHQVAVSMGTVASMDTLLKSIDFLTGLIPSLVAELENVETSRQFAPHSSMTPKRASFSRRPNDYQMDSNHKRLLPARWAGLLPVARMDHRPLRWLLHLLNLQSAALQQLGQRMDKYIDNALEAQQGTSSYAHYDRTTLLNMQQRLATAYSRLNHARMMLMRSTELCFMPSESPPSPYPRSEAWTRLRRFAQHLINPHAFLSGFLDELLNGQQTLADTPYLYQRWCGIKMLAVLEKLGWVPQSDPTGAIFLGGEIQLLRQGIKISLWVEPRFAQNRHHPSGFACRLGNETHPDYLLVTPGPYGTEAFILDPTTTADKAIRRSKSKYLYTIEALEMSSVAGIPTVRNPLRAWSAAPMHLSHCELDDAKGCTGTVPMHPLDWSSKPLMAWLKDIDSYAIAWGSVSSALNKSGMANKTTIAMVS